MIDHAILLPSKPRVVSEDTFRGVYEIDGLYPGYGHTLGNSLRRIVLSSMPGAAITSIKIDGVHHEFSTIEGVKEDVILIILNLKKVRFHLDSNEPQVVTLDVKGAQEVHARDIKVSGQVEVLNGDQYLCQLTDKKAELKIEITVERGLGFVQKDAHQKSKVDIGTIALDALFSPVRRVAYEVEDMRVGDRTNHNRLRMIIETDGTLSPREALERSIRIMIEQLGAILDFKPDILESVHAPLPEVHAHETASVSKDKEDKEDLSDVMKIRIDTLELSTRVENALTQANIRTIGGVARKRADDLLEIEGMGEKGLQEIKKVLSGYGITLK